MDIGIPVERKQGEGRVALTPNAVAEIISRGARVHVETGAGQASGFTDQQYSQTGATIHSDPEKLYKSATLIVKVKEPIKEDLAYIKSHHTLFCYLHLAANPKLIAAFKKIGNSALAFELVEVEGSYPLLAPMSDIAGKVAIQLGMHYLMTAQGGAGILLEGGYGAERANVVVLGGGIAGISAAKRAAAIGANVIVFDIKAEVLKRANDIGCNVTGLYSQTQSIEVAVKAADLVIGAVLLPGKQPPIILPISMLRQMKPGAVVVDIAIDQGGCVEGIKTTSYDAPCYQEHGVQMLAVANLPGAVPKTAAQCLSGAILPYVLALVSDSCNIEKIAMGESMNGLKNAICIKNGQLVGQ